MDASAESDLHELDHHAVGILHDDGAHGIRAFDAGGVGLAVGGESSVDDPREHRVEIGGKVGKIEMCMRVGEHQSGWFDSD